MHIPNKLCQFLISRFLVFARTHRHTDAKASSTENDTCSTSTGNKMTQCDYACTKDLLSARKHYKWHKNFKSIETAAKEILSINNEQTDTLVQS